MKIIFFLLALAASIIGSISGIGGGIIIKPVMDAMQIMDISTISFLSGCTVLTMALSSFLRNRKDNSSLDYSISFFLAVGASIGGIAGKALFTMVSHGLGTIQSVALLIINLFVLIYVLNKNRVNTLHTKKVSHCLAIGVALGCLSAFLGIGGGPLNIAILYYFFSMDAKVSARTSLFIILFSQITSLLTTIVTRTVPHFDVEILILMCLGGVVGAMIGSKIHQKVSHKTIENLFLLLMVFLIFLNIHNVLSSIS